ncbi:ROK family protein [Gramella sp. AN32]|uniref:ROK family protein n=1 Tax=Christiangramia antarctica TaxID=2058158 RepID=A0ABW5X4W8_9FLAO|nr:ROK family protein [Gramella sp. AN32]MCM4157807.1 hypothetical protein [Gramella sp. AN32]
MENPIVLTLDAGGTNMSFMAMQNKNFLCPPVLKETVSDNLDRCLDLIVEGFQDLIDMLEGPPAAISFAFPGPADYSRGIIGDLFNIPCFKGGVALGPFLENEFKLPVFINNDGDLFTYGEFMAGFLSDLNDEIEKNNSRSNYKSLFGITLGTGFGGGLVINGELITGENSASSEIWLMRHFQNNKLYVEEGVSIRSIQNDYCRYSGNQSVLSPQEIYNIAIGSKTGHQKAAYKAFENIGINIGEALANVITLLDCPIVIGGGISGAADIIIPSIIKHLSGKIQSFQGEKIPRIIPSIYNYDQASDRCKFLEKSFQRVKIPRLETEVIYENHKKIPIGVSRLGTNKATAIGAYYYALKALKKS